VLFFSFLFFPVFSISFLSPSLSFLALWPFSPSDLTRRCRVDEAIQDFLLPKDAAKSSDSARFIIDMLSGFDLHGIQALTFTMTDKKLYADEDAMMMRRMCIILL
jgi:hypothetical protein